LEDDLKQCIEEMKKYVDNGYELTFQTYDEEPFTVDGIYQTNFHSLIPVESSSKFLSVDASFYPLIRANNWVIGVSRCAYVIIEKVNGEWIVLSENYQDHIFPVLAPLHKRPFGIWAKLKEYESRMAVSLLDKLDKEDFCLMDGKALFGSGIGENKYSLDLYYGCRKRDVRLLMIPKKSTLQLSRNRDLLATINRYASKLQKEGKIGGCWIYYPITFPKVKDFYGDISCVKLSPSSNMVFRCDLMDYIVEKGKNYMVKTISELSTISNDPRCNGYPAPLFLAHERTRIPKAKLLEYLEKLHLKLAENGLLDFLLVEAEIASLRRSLLGLTYDFEMVEDMEV